MPCMLSYDLQKMRYLYMETRKPRSPQNPKTQILRTPCSRSRALGLRIFGSPELSESGFRGYEGAQGPF